MSDKKYLGVMVDCSRNAVLSVSSAKRLIDALKKMGYNMLMLYTEDTWEVDNQPFFGYMRDRFSQSELINIIDYAEENGIEVIPCIQTLGHLSRIFRWNEYKASVRDVNDILLVGEDKTYELIDDMLKTVKKCFRSKKIHIGMDEAYKVGLGKYLELNGYTDRFTILKNHLAKVCEMVKEYDLEPIMWSDMFFAIANDGQYYAYRNPDIITEEIAALVPKNIELCYWDYFTNAQWKCDNMIAAHRNFNRPLWFAGAALSWYGFTPHNISSQVNLGEAMNSCRENNVDNVIITIWGDDGGETSVFALLPSLLFAAEKYNGNDDIGSIKAKFKELFGMEFDDFMKLEYPATLDNYGNPNTDTPDRYFLYNDVFYGLYDDLIGEDIEKWKSNYRNYVRELNVLANNKEYGYLFDSSAALCDVMAVKIDLGKRTRDAYKNSDKESLKALLEDYELACEKLVVFHSKFRNLWYKDKKLGGFEIQDIRLGGLIQRLKTCKQTLSDYIEGKIEAIPQLEQELLKFEDEKAHKERFWGKNVSCNTLSEFSFSFY